MQAKYDYSRYPFVQVISSVLSSVVFPKLKQMLSTREVAEVIKTNNDPSFNSEELSKHTENTGFKHRKITSLLVHANKQQ